MAHARRHARAVSCARVTVARTANSFRALELVLLLELLLLELLLLELLLLELLLLLETDHEERELPRRSVRLGARTAQPSTRGVFSPHSEFSVMLLSIC